MIWEVVFWDEPSLQAVLPGAGMLIPPSAHQLLVTGFQAPSKQNVAPGSRKRQLQHCPLPQ